MSEPYFYLLPVSTCLSFKTLSNNKAKPPSLLAQTELIPAALQVLQPNPCNPSTSQGKERRHRLARALRAFIWAMVFARIGKEENHIVDGLRYWLGSFCMYLDP